MQQVRSLYCRQTLLMGFQRHLQDVQPCLRRPVDKDNRIEFGHASQLRPAPTPFAVEQPVRFGVLVFVCDFWAVHDYRHLLAVRQHVLPQGDEILFVELLPGLFLVPLDVSDADSFEFSHERSFQ